MTDFDHAQRQETAAVVLYWVQRRGMTYHNFADRMGKSLSWVDKIRAGDRQLDRLSVLRQISRVLDIPLAVLIDPEEAERRRTCPDDREIRDIRQALRRYDAITNVFRPGGDVLPEPNLAKLERAGAASRLDGVSSIQLPGHRATLGRSHPQLPGSRLAARG